MKTLEVRPCQGAKPGGMLTLRGFDLNVQTAGGMLVEDYLRPAAVKTGVLKEGEKVRFGFHNLRHSLASFLVRKGTDAKTVQAILRHSDVTTTLGIYAHSMSEDRLAAQDDMLAAMMTKSNAVN